MTNQQSCHKFILGLTDDETAVLDLDEFKFKTAKYWAIRTMKWFKLGGYLILRSSQNNYHVVFDRKVSWAENMKIVAWVCLLSHKPKLVKWFLMQCIKGASTLRVGNKQEKSSPRIVCRYGSQEMQIKDFLAHRKVIRSINRKVSIFMQKKDAEKSLLVEVEREEDYPLRIVHIQ